MAEITHSPEIDNMIKLLRANITDHVTRSMAFPEILFCTVKSVSPLTLTADDFSGVTISKNIVVSEKVTDHEVEMIAIKPEPHRTSTEQSIMGTDSDFRAHNHTYGGGWFRAKYGLKEGDKVIVFRHSDGQRYWVADRVGE